MEIPRSATTMTIFCKTFIIKPIRSLASPSLSSGFQLGMTHFECEVRRLAVRILPVKFSPLTFLIKTKLSSLNEVRDPLVFLNRPVMPSVSEAAHLSMKNHFKSTISEVLKDQLPETTFIIILLGLIIYFCALT